ncbi:hypothetical protein NPIL_626841 [Nephila pilipes]|uniref:Uncharacterized protein n=1 Tax=Nephila pilipes TaxID=299642 RepID=A0A8X6PPN8_NEPPI|nr:hypothetical protein NPIL_626841 [Nephila pilipes]
MRCSNHHTRAERQASYFRCMEAQTLSIFPSRCQVIKDPVREEANSLIHQGRSLEGKCGLGGATNTIVVTGRCPNRLWLEIRVMEYGTNNR